MGAELNPTAPPTHEFPRGYQFVPTDLELIRYYLTKKINNDPLPPVKIYEVDVYECNPDMLTANYPKLGANAWYFFSSRKKKYRNGTRPDRAAGNGFWKATGQYTYIEDENERTVGRKDVLVYHEGSPKHNKKTNWLMQEFKLNQPQPSRNTGNAVDMKLDECVLYKIYKRVTRRDNNNDYDDDNNDDDKDNNSSSSNNFGPIVIYNNDATQMATDNNSNHGVPNDDTTSVVDDVDFLFHCLTNNSFEPTLQDVLPNQNVPEVPSSHINSSFDVLEDCPSALPVNYPAEPSFSYVQGRNIQQQDFQVQETQNCDIPPQMDTSDICLLGTQNFDDPFQTEFLDIGFSWVQDHSNPPEVGTSNIGFGGTRDCNNPPQIGPTNVGFSGTQDFNNLPPTESFNVDSENPPQTRPSIPRTLDFNNHRQIEPSNVDSENPPQTGPSDL